MNRLSRVYAIFRIRLRCLARLPGAGIVVGRGAGCLALVVLTGCVAPVPNEAQDRLPTDAEVEQYNAQVAPEDRIVCRDEVSVGSNIPRRRCRFIRDMEETSRFTREQLRNILH